MNKNIRIAKELVKLAKHLVSYRYEYDYQNNDYLFIHEPDLEKLCDMIINDELNEKQKQEAIQKIIDDGDYYLLQSLIIHNKVNNYQKKKIILCLVGQVSNNYESDCNISLIRLLKSNNLNKDQETTILNALVDNDCIRHYYYRLKYFKPEQIQIILNRAVYNLDYDLLHDLIFFSSNLLTKDQRKKIIFTLMEQDNMINLNQLMKDNKLTNEQKLFIHENQYM